MKTKLLFICIFFICTLTIYAQESPSNYVVKRDNAQISVGYFRVNRHQIDGSTIVRFNKDFDYITPGSGFRFAPDEPSSFSFINYIFADNNRNCDFFMSLFRNHTKGDFLFSDFSDVHFGKGNSQIGLGLGLDLGFPIKTFSLSGSLLWGFGPQFTKLTSGNRHVSPEKWGVRGLGSVLVSGVNLNSPTFWNIFSVTLSVKSTLHYAGFFDFEVMDDDGVMREFSDVDFVSYGISPMLQLNFELGKHKKASADL